MKREHAEQLATRVRGESPGSAVLVEHVHDGAPDPYGYVLIVDGQRISSPAAWLGAQPAEEEEKPVPFALRLPPELKADLEDLSRGHERSLNSEIVFALRQYVYGG